jgi:hypothetical protein
MILDCLEPTFPGLDLILREVYPRSLDKKALAASLPCTESALKHRIVIVTDNLLRGQDRGRSISDRLFALVLFVLWRREYEVTF